MSDKLSLIKTLLGIGLETAIPLLKTTASGNTTDVVLHGAESLARLSSTPKGEEPGRSDSLVAAMKELRETHPELYERVIKELVLKK